MHGFVFVCNSADKQIWPLKLLAKNKHDLVVACLNLFITAKEIDM